MTEEVGFRVSADTGAASAAFKEFADKASTEAARAAESIKSIAGASDGLEDSLSRTVRGHERISSATRDTARIVTRDLSPAWERIYGRAGERDIRSSVAQMERFHSVLQRAGQAGKAFSAIDWDASDELKKHEEAIKRVHTAWTETMAAPRNRLLRQELAGYGAQNAAPHDILTTFLPMIYGARSGVVARRLLADTAFRAGPGALPEVSPVSGESAFEGAAAAGATAGVMSKLGRFLRFLPGVGTLLTGMGAMSLGNRAGENLRDADPLWRSISGNKDSFYEFNKRLLELGDGLATDKRETIALERMYLAGSGGMSEDMVHSGTQAAIGFAKGGGGSSAAMVQAMAAAGWYGITKDQAGQKEFAARIASALEGSKLWEKSDEVLGQALQFMQQSGSVALGGPNLAGYLDLYTALNKTGEPLARGQGAADLIGQADAAIRSGGARGPASQSFIMDALARYGVKGGYATQFLMDQGAFAQIKGAGGKTVLDAVMENLDIRSGREDSEKKALELGGLLGMTGPQAQVFMDAWHGMGSSGFGGFQSWLGKIGMASPGGYSEDALRELSALYQSGRGSTDAGMSEALEIMKAGRIPTAGSEFAESVAKLADANQDLGEQLVGLVTTSNTLLSKVVENTARALDNNFWLKRDPGYDYDDGDTGKSIMDVMPDFMKNNYSDPTTSAWAGLRRAQYTGGGGGYHKASYGPSRRYGGGKVRAETGGAWGEHLRALEAEYGLDRGMLSGIENAETGGMADPDSAVSKAGAMGRFQFMPGTWAEFGEGSPWNKYDSARASARYLAHIRDYLKRKGIAPTPENIAAGYNAGPGAVEKYGTVPPYPETQGYIPRFQAGMEAATKVEVVVTVQDPNGRTLPSTTAPPKVARPKPWGGVTRES